MKTFYFASASSGLPKRLDEYKKIVEIVESNRCIIIDQWFEKHKWNAENIKDVEENAKNRSTVMIRKCDFVVAETSIPSTGMGHQISYALEHHVPVLCLCKEEKFKQLSFIIKTYDSNILEIFQYKNDKELKRIIKTYIQNLTRDSYRFNFILPRELDNYLTERAIKAGISKAVYLRNLLKDDREEAENKDKRPINHTFVPPKF